MQPGPLDLWTLRFVCLKHNVNGFFYFAWLDQQEGTERDIEGVGCDMS